MTDNLSESGLYDVKIELDYNPKVQVQQIRACWFYLMNPSMEQIATGDGQYWHVELHDENDIHRDTIWAGKPVHFPNGKIKYKQQIANYLVIQDKADRIARVLTIEKPFQIKMNHSVIITDWVLNHRLIVKSQV